MVDRLIKWFGFSIGLTSLPILLSLFLRATLKININFSDYTNELIFMAVTLSATSLGDVFSLLKKGATGIHMTIISFSLIFISLICMATYEIHTVISTLSVSYNPMLINILTIIGFISSAVIGVFCQIYLEKIERGNP